MTYTDLHSIEQQTALVSLVVWSKVVEVKEADFVNGIVGAAGQIAQAHNDKHLHMTTKSDNHNKYHTRNV